MKEKSKLSIKPKYAFGSAGKPEFDIPRNAEVEFTVFLRNFEKVSFVLRILLDIVFRFIDICHLIFSVKRLLVVKFNRKIRTG